MTAATPQTISFTLTCRYMQNERPSELPTSMDFHFTEFEAMLTFYRKERRRRKLADRATAGTYKHVLTTYGWQRCANDVDCAGRHRDAIKGTEFKLQTTATATMKDQNNVRHE